MTVIVAAILVTGTMAFQRYVWPDLQQHLVVNKLERLSKEERLKLYQESYPIFLEATASRPRYQDRTLVSDATWGAALEELNPVETIACENHFKIRFPGKVGLEVWPDLNDIGPGTGYGVTLAVEGKRRIYMRGVDLNLQSL